VGREGYVAKRLKVISPVDGQVYAERPLAGASEIEIALETARKVQRAWQETSVEEPPRSSTGRSRLSSPGPMRLRAR